MTPFVRKITRKMKRPREVWWIIQHYNQQDGNDFNEKSTGGGGGGKAVEIRETYL